MRSRGIESEHRARCLGGAAWSSGCSFERIDLVRISGRAGDEGRGLPWLTPKGRSGTEQAQTSVPPKKRFSNRQSRLGTGWGSGSERSVCGEPTEGWQERRVWGHKIWAAGVARGRFPGVSHGCVYSCLLSVLQGGPPSRCVPCSRPSLALFSYSP